MFYLLNKHSGVTSFGIIYQLRKKFGIKKIGHTGTLDPLATGLLLVATGNSTKLIPYLDKKEKTYIFSFNINGLSPTGDLEGAIEYVDDKILKEKEKTITKELIQEIINTKFNGKITQIPPKYSAIKVDGKRAYELARNGKEFEMKKREIEILSSKLISYNFPEIKLEMTVTAGTYIRTIAEDISRELGLEGYVTYLHRSKIGSINEELSKKLELIEEGDYIDENILFPEFSKIEVSSKQLEDIFNGKELTFDGLIEGEKYFITFEGKNKSLVEAKDGKIVVIRNGL
ncbi:MAG: tRNA pseudouridine(55) synthase TruB [Candidatus Gracilibacteria bacterium]|nr:tRNA pseudouridine(55) synthase TruB [Candidatus Gracilibacteria bacterium]MDD2908276.1 tRNA pseudouridine(55) synthase TruB [Candidatus Gracilibacteria bacterium]